MAEVNCVALKDWHQDILSCNLLSVDSLLFLSELHLTLQLRFNFKESRLLFLKSCLLWMYIMYFWHQSENAFISYVIVFWQAGHAILPASVCCFVRRSVCSALSALSLTQESVFNFLTSNCLLFKYSLCKEHSETTNIARLHDYRRNAKHGTREALAHFRVTWQRSYCSVDRKGYSKCRNFSCDHEALFAGQHKQLEVDVSEFRVESVTPSWDQIYIFCSLGYLSVNQKKAFLGALWG